MEDYKETILGGEAVLGIELGSTRIKAVLIGKDKLPIASGSHEWENSYENGIWTYSLESIWNGLQDSYNQLLTRVKADYGVAIESLAGIGFSAMMHGYMAFDGNDNLLVPFRTWRNTITEKASDILTKEFDFHIPQRWSIAHLYQAILNNETHVKDISFLTTLAGYIHKKLTGERVLGIGEASGMFPIDSLTNNYDKRMLSRFDKLISDRGYEWTIEEILPKVLMAGERGGVLTAEGAKLLDVSGQLRAGALVCPPEGDAGTGMVATNSVKKRTANVSAGTSVFAMAVLEKPLAKAYSEIDMVTTPDGSPVAMVHCNNCTSDLNAWVNLFKEFSEAFGVEVDMTRLYSVLYNKALEGDEDCGGMLAYNYFSGEHITGFEEGRPLFVRTPDSSFNLANFMRTHLFTAVSALKIGMDILFREERVELDKIYGHGGLFKTKEVGQRIMAAALNVPVTVMETAGEGGAWGIAILADYMLNKEKGESLGAYLEEKIFAGKEGLTIEPQEAEVKSFDAFAKSYKAGLAIEKAAVNALK